MADVFGCRDHMLCFRHTAKCLFYAGHLPSAAADTVWLSRKARRKKRVSQVVFLCILSAASAGARLFTLANFLNIMESLYAKISLSGIGS